MISDELRRPVLAVPELRMLVGVAMPECDPLHRYLADLHDRNSAASVIMHQASPALGQEVVHGRN